MLANELELVDESHQANDRLLKEIKAALEKEDIKLPAMPDVAIKIREAFKDEQYEVAQIARLIQAEAGLTAYVLKIANSPLHRGPIPIETAKHAICRLGQHSVQSIVLTYTMRALFKSPSPTLKVLLQDQWQESTSIAAISAILAERCEGFDPDQALLAGLLQDIGALPIIDWLAHKQVPENEMEQEFLQLKERLSAQIGEMILKSWDFSDKLVEVVKAREDWHRDSGIEVDTADIVTIGRHHYYMSINKPNPDIQEIAAYHKLPFKDLTPDQTLAILEESREEIAVIKGMLS